MRDGKFFVLPELFPTFSKISKHIRIKSQKIIRLAAGNCDKEKSKMYEFNLDSLNFFFGLSKLVEMFSTYNLLTD